MSFIFVVHSKKGKLNVPTIVRNAMSKMNDQDQDQSDLLQKSGMGFGNHYEAVNCTITADARIDYQEDLAKKLGIESESAKEMTDDQLILAAYLEWGEKCVNHLYGDFAFSIWDDRVKKLFCARDHFGCRPLYYMDNPEYFIIASSMSVFEAVPGFKYQIREQAIYDAICSVDQEKGESPYMDIYRLEPAHSLSYSSRGIKLCRFWELKQNVEYTSHNEEEACMELQNRILSAISQRTRINLKTGVELSGGLDSSGILAGLIYNEGKGAAVTAYTHSRTEACSLGQDASMGELHYSRFLVKELEIENHVIVTGEGQEGSYKAMLGFLDNIYSPVNDTYAMLSDLLYREAGRLGTGVLLSGFGGDEGVSFHGGVYLNELARKGEFKRLMDNIRMQCDRTGGSYFNHLIKVIFRTFFPQIMNLFHQDWRKQQFKTFAIDNVISKRMRMKQRFFQQTFLPVGTNLRTRQYNRLMLNGISQRLENSCLMARKQGLEYSYPFLDVKLIEYVFSLPSAYKYKNGMGRFLYRNALEGIVPDKIRLRIDKEGVTVPNVISRLIKDEDKFKILIEEGRNCNKFHYVDYDKLHSMLHHFRKLEHSKDRKVTQRTFYAPISILIFQKWQREGKINIGIKC